MKPKPLLTKRELLLGLSGLWFLLVVIAYFAVNKPLEPQSALALAQVGRTGLAWIGMLALANLIGRTQGQRLGGFRPVERLALQIGLGLGALSLVVIGLSAVGALSPALFWLLILLPSPFGLLFAVRDLRPVLRRPGRMRAEWLIVGLAGGGALLLALAPPTAWDALVYQLAGPELYLEQGGLRHTLDLPYLGFPKTAAMLFMMGLSLSGPQLAQLLHLTFAGLTLALLPRLLHGIAPGRGGLAAAILVSVPSMWLIAGWAYVEWITAFWLLASFVLIRAPVADSSSSRTTALAGLCAGFALATKYSSLWMALGLVVVAGLNRRSVRQLSIFLLAAGAALLPSLLVNWATTGNPVYPFVFDGLYWDAHRAQWFSRFGTGLAPARLLLAGLEATVFGLEGGYFVGHPSYGATIGPLLLGLAPLALLRLASKPASRPGSMRDLIVIVAAGSAGWIAQLAASALLVQTRLLFPLFPFLAAAAAIGYDSLGQLSRRIQFVLGGLIAFVLSVALIGYLAQALGGRAAEVVTGRLAPEAYLTARLGAHYQAIQAVNQLPAGSQVRFLWEPRSYYCEPTIVCEPDAVLDRWWHARQHLSSVEDILADWRERGVTHVLYYRVGAAAVRQEGFDPLTPADWDELDRLLGELLIPAGETADSYTLYALP